MNKNIFLKVILVALSLFLCGFRFKDGTYEGRSFKFPGAFKVSLTIKNQKIATIEIIKHLALQRYTDMLQPLINEIIQKQAVEADAITGATLSSNALKKAVKDALKKANAQ